MKRGKSQALYRALPSMMMDFNKCIIQITKWDCNELRDINKTRIVQSIHRNIKPFIINRKIRGFPSKPNPAEYALLEPRRIEGRVRPLTFLCNNRKCNAAYSFYLNEAHKVVKKFGTKFNCPRCKTGNIFQWDMIYHDWDGKLDFVSLPSSFPNKDSISLIRIGKKPSKWRWMDKNNTSNTISLNRRNYNTGNLMYAKPFRTSSVIYLHSEDFINISTEDEEAIFSNQDASKLKIAEYLGLLKKYNVTFDSMLKIKGTHKDTIKTKDSLELLKEKGVDDKIIQALSDKLKEENPSGMENKIKIIEEVGNLIKPLHEDYTDIAIECFDYLETLSIPTIKNVEDVVAEAENEDKPNIHIIRKFPSTFENVGIEKAFIARDLAILSTVYGFTRKEKDPSKAVLNRFHTSLDDDEDEERTPIFAVRKNTEAIVLQLDRLKVLKWLSINGVKINFDELKSEESLKCWFLNHIESEKISRFSEIGEDVNKETKLVYNLIHSMSHALLIQASFQCGYEKESLGEIILPSIPAFAIYFKAANDYQLGGMYTLFENFIIPWIDDAKELIRSCIYDPICKNGEGACHACLHISEGSCTHFNKDLGRFYLTGSKNKNIKGFWKMSDY